MGIMDFVKGGVREMMIARPDQFKPLIVYKHPDQNIPFWSQLTVDSDSEQFVVSANQFLAAVSA